MIFYFFHKIGILLVHFEVMFQFLCSIITENIENYGNLWFLVHLTHTLRWLNVTNGAVHKWIRLEICNLD